MKISQIKNSDIFHISTQNIDFGYSLEISAQNIDYGYSLEPPRRCGSNEYPQSMFCVEIRKIIFTPVNPSFTILKWGLMGSKLCRHMFVMDIYTYIFQTDHSKVVPLLYVFFIRASVVSYVTLVCHFCATSHHLLVLRDGCASWL